MINYVSAHCTNATPLLTVHTPWNQQAKRECIGQTAANTRIRMPIDVPLVLVSSLLVSPTRWLHLREAATQDQRPGIYFTYLVGTSNRLLATNNVYT